jgi:hypothetical protein
MELAWSLFFLNFIFASPSLRPSTVVLLHLLLQNGTFHSTHSYSLIHILLFCISSLNLSFIQTTRAHSIFSTPNHLLSLPPPHLASSAGPPSLSSAPAMEEGQPRRQPPSLARSARRRPRHQSPLLPHQRGGRRKQRMARTSCGGGWQRSRGPRRWVAEEPR